MAEIDRDEDLGFDQVLDRLRLVVDKLEGGKLGLEEQLAAFEQGVGLARRGSRSLELAERRVEELLGQGETRPAPDDGA